MVNPDNILGPVIHTYTRAQAIEDGVLIDVSEMARQAGFKVPVAVTQGLWGEFITPPAAVVHCQDQAGRLWDVLWMAVCQARVNPGTSHLSFQVLFQQIPNFPPKAVELWAITDGGDDGELVITIMRPEDY